MRGTQSESNLLSPSHPPSKTPQRSYRACTWCRAHKRKCDGLEPCTTCANSPDGRKCEYAPPQKRGRKIKRQYDDKLSIEHVVRRRPDELASFPLEVSPPVISRTYSSIVPLRIPESRHLNEGHSNINIFHNPIELPPPMPIPRYPDSLTSPQRYNYSSKYSLSSPEIRARGNSQESIPIRLPQIWSDNEDDITLRRENSFSVLPSPRHPNFYDSSSNSLSVSGASETLPPPSLALSEYKTLRDSDFITDSTNRAASQSHPLMLPSTRRLNLQIPYTPLADRLNHSLGPEHTGYHEKKS